MHECEKILSVLHVYEQAGLDNKQPLCQTERYKHTKLHKQAWLPFRLMHILNEEHVQTQPGAQQVCTVHPKGTWLKIALYDSVVCLWLLLRAIWKGESNTLIWSTKILTSQELLACPLFPPAGVFQKPEWPCLHTWKVNEMQRSRKNFFRLLL